MGGKQFAGTGRLPWKAKQQKTVKWGDGKSEQVGGGVNC